MRDGGHTEEEQAPTMATISSVGIPQCGPVSPLGSIIERDAQVTLPGRDPSSDSSTVTVPHGIFRVSRRVLAFSLCRQAKSVVG